MKAGFNINFYHTLKIAIIISVCGFLFFQANANGKTLLPDQAFFPKWYFKSFASEQKLMKSIRNSLARGEKVVINPDLDMNYNPTISQIYLTLFQEGQKLIRWGGRKSSIEQSINRNCQKIRNHKRFKNFDIENPKKCRILLEIVTSEHPVDINKVSTLTFDANRFEPGITGYKFKYKKSLYYYMPTDATVHSHLDLKHTLNYISKKVGVSRQTNKISKRIEILKSLPIEFSMIESRAFITFGENVIPLYRGYPVPVEFSKDRILETAKNSVDWVIKHMNDNGKFLYYYDGVQDTVIDHQHRNMTDPLYYNILVTSQ